MRSIYRLAFCALFFLCACQTNEQQEVNFYTSELFKAVQQNAIFPDSKTFVDCNPNFSIEKILEAYEAKKGEANFNLEEFVNSNFTCNVAASSNFKSDTSLSLQDHINSLWPILTHQPDDYNAHSSLIPLPKSYIVPGGRFGEIYYWDSYFTQLGLMRSNASDMAENMVDNFTFLIDTIGFIPNGNRAYYLGRSQPPFYSLMVKLVTKSKPEDLIEYLPFLEKEYRFWMDGEDNLSRENNTNKRVVRLNDGTILNRYWDNFAIPRPESYKEDVELAEASTRPSEEMYRHLRAAAESGWDFSSRWLSNPSNLGSIQTTDIIPIDLNCLIYHLETLIAEAATISGDHAKVMEYEQRANNRKTALLKLCWNEEKGFFEDYNFKKRDFTGILSLAGAYPLFFNMVNDNQAQRVTEVLGSKFLKPGGFVTTLEETGQQWDAPNGWAPLQWMTIKGLLNYQQLELAMEAIDRWLAINNRVYKQTGKMVEKYNVNDISLLAGGGEYPVQDGFGWSNGVALELLYVQSEVEEELLEAQEDTN